MNDSATALDRGFAALSYVMPLAAALQVSEYFFRFLAESVPQALTVVSVILTPLMPLIQIENSFFGIFIFIALFVFVVRNTNISRFIRFNVLQAILVSFMISIGSLILSVLGLTSSFIGETLLNVLFLGGMAVVIYAVAQSVLGRYAEIPTISEAVNMQMPY
ncbi:MAG: Tic20 family protein [Phormidesmis sp.]